MSAAQTTVPGTNGRGGRTGMYGYSLMCEGTPPKDLVRQAVMAEEAGFDFVTISDHIHPWLTSQEHSGYAWSILGAVAQATSRVLLTPMVTCPIVRYHPVIVAQMAATMAILSDDRFVLGLGSGERLNEHVVGRGWPAVDVRHEMLAEAIEIIKRLWQGGYVTHRGRYLSAEDARVFDLPDRPIPFYVAAGGTRAATLAAEAGGGLCNTEPKPGPVEAFTQGGGDPADTWAQVVCSWDATVEGGLATAHESFRFAAGGWKVQAELPNPVNFDAATKNVRPEDLAESVPAGPDPQRHRQGIQQFRDAGYNHVAIAYPGEDVEGFLRFWGTELRPQLVGASATA